MACRVFHALNLQWYHILIILPATSMVIDSYKSYGYCIIYLLIIAQFFLDCYTTTDPV